MKRAQFDKLNFRHILLRDSNRISNICDDLTLAKSMQMSLNERNI